MIKKIIVGICVALIGIQLISLPFNDWNFKKMNYFGANIHIVASNSMIPEFKAGDIAITYKTDFDKLEVGDVITYLDDNKIIIHRIVEINDGFIKTKGDNNSTEDKVLIDRQNYLGKLIYHTKF